MRSDLLARPYIAAVSLLAVGLLAVTDVSADEAWVTTDPVVSTGRRIYDDYGGFGYGGLDGGGGRESQDYMEEMFDAGESGGGDVANAPTNSSPGTCPLRRGNPINIATGNKVEYATDFTSQGVEMPLRLDRTYNYNAYTTDLLFGAASWRSSFDYSFEGAPTSYNIAITRPDGGVTIFRKDNNSPDRWWESKAEPVAYITYANGVFTHNGSDGMVAKYTKPVGAGFYQISSLTNRAGVGWAFTYGNFQPAYYPSHPVHRVALLKVTHTNGKAITLNWINGRLASVLDPAGNTHSYHYNELIYGTSKWYVLSKVVAPTGEYTEYHYDDVRALTGKSIAGARYSTFTYLFHNERGFVGTSTEHSGGVERYAFDYESIEAGGFRTIETNPLGKKSVYVFSSAGKLLSITGEPSSACPRTFREMAYDPNGYQDVTTDFNGNITDYDYSPSGRLIRKTLGSGTAEARTTEYQWDAVLNEPTRVTINGLRQTDYTYNADGRVTSVAVRSLTSHVANSAIRTTTYSYEKHPNGTLAKVIVDGPLPGAGDSVTQVFSPSGDLLSVTNSLGQVTTYEGYNLLGLPRFITGPSGDKRGFVYDASGRIAEAQAYRDGGTQSTYYKYDDFGRLALVTMPDGTKHGYQYDVAGRKISEYESESGGTFAQAVYTYNALSLPTSIKKQRVAVEPNHGTLRP